MTTPKNDSALLHQRLSGCPFNNFGPCVAEQCFFFTPAQFGSDRSGCLFLSQYYQTISMGIVAELQALEEIARPGARPAFPAPLRFAHNIADSLRSLAALQRNPALSPDLRATLSEALALIAPALEDMR